MQVGGLRRPGEGGGGNRRFSEVSCPTRTESHGGQKEGKGRLPCGRELHRPLALEGRDRSWSLDFTEPRGSRSSVLSMNPCRSGIQNQASTTSYYSVSLRASTTCPSRDGPEGPPDRDGPGSVPRRCSSLLPWLRKAAQQA